MGNNSDKPKYLVDDYTSIGARLRELEAKTVPTQAPPVAAAPTAPAAPAKGRLLKVAAAQRCDLCEGRGYVERNGIVIGSCPRCAGRGTI